MAALGDGDWAAFGRAAVGAVVLFVVFFVLVMISPRSIGMGDAKLAALLGLGLGWLGATTFSVLGVLAGFVVQALLALVLLATPPHRAARGTALRARDADRSRVVIGGSGGLLR